MPVSREAPLTAVTPIPACQCGGGGPEKPRRGRSFECGIWWDGLGASEARNGYSPETEELHAQIRIGRLHIWWGADQ